MTKCSILSLLSVSLILAACSSGESTNEYSSIYESNKASIDSSSSVIASSGSGSIASEPLPNSDPTQNEDMRITTGGLVITKGGPGGMSTGLDTDGTARVNFGTLIVFGRPEKTPALGNGVTSYTLSGSYSVGTYTVSNTINTVDVATKHSYTAIYVYFSETARYTVTKK